jgi:hypothetical protein
VHSFKGLLFVLQIVLAAQIVEKTVPFFIIIIVADVFVKKKGTCLRLQLVGIAEVSCVQRSGTSLSFSFSFFRFFYTIPQQNYFFFFLNKKIDRALMYVSIFWVM